MVGALASACQSLFPNRCEDECTDVRQVTAEALAGAASALDRVTPEWASHTGTYVGCMFTDYMNLLLQGHGWPTSGPLLTGTDALLQPLFAKLVCC